jgi:hypothetical protein
MVTFSKCSFGILVRRIRMLFLSINIIFLSINVIAEELKKYRATKCSTVKKFEFEDEQFQPRQITGK